tara:strand:- start:8 stop:193 length:186 start_codon:yes stop_codon:yes gene_type:complete
MGTRISSPGDTYFQGRGRSDVTNTDLGKTKTTREEDKIIESLMGPRAKALEKMRKKGPKPA